MITKIKVVAEDGKPIDMNRSLARNLLRIIDGLFVYLVGAILVWHSIRSRGLGEGLPRP
jgi:uncharacterized RDD family membrane protein YckC